MKKTRSTVVRWVLLAVAILLILDVIQHPSGTGNQACYPSLRCYHHTTHVRTRRSG